MAMAMASLPCRKRKLEAMGDQLVSAAAGGIADRALCAALGRYGALKSADELLEHLEWLVMEVSGGGARRSRPQPGAAPVAAEPPGRRSGRRGRGALLPAAAEAEAEPRGQQQVSHHQGAVGRRPGGQEGAAGR